MKHKTQWNTVAYPNDPSDDRLQGEEWNERHVMELEAEPSDPELNTAIMWFSNGSGIGQLGDLVIKKNIGGVIYSCIGCPATSDELVVRITPEYLDGYRYTDGLQAINYQGQHTETSSLSSMMLTIIGV